MNKTIAIIPAYNEQLTIKKVVQNTKKFVDEVLVIDDGSTDNTAYIAKDTGANVITHIINQGIGGAQTTGYVYAIRNNFDFIVQLDADGQHNPKYIPQMLELAEEYDIVIGSRFLNQSYKEYSKLRVIGIRFFSWLTYILGGKHIKDITSGYRVYKVDALKSLTELPPRHWAVEQTLEAMKKGMKLKEISVEMPVREKGKSQFNPKTFIMYPLRVSERILRVILWR